MTLDQIPSGTRVFVDSNVLIYAFQPHAVFGAVCNRLVARIGIQDIEGYTAAPLLGELAHRLMIIEAAGLPGWAGGKVMNRLKQQPAVVQQLSAPQAAVNGVMQSRIRVLPVEGGHFVTAAALSRQHGLLTNDALILALMHAEVLTAIASHDADFDRVPGITRYAPA